MDAPRQYRKKPVVIQAIRWTGSNLREVVAFTGKHPRWGEWFATWEEYETRVRADGHIFKILTLEGTMHASPGDWIIRGVRGEHYPCKPDIFAATYEPSDLAPSARRVPSVRESLEKAGIPFVDSGEVERLSRPGYPDDLAPPPVAPSSRALESSARERRLASALVSMCQKFGPQTEEELAAFVQAKRVLASPEAPAKAWVEVQFSPDFGFYVALVPLVPLGCVGFQVDGFTESEDEALVTAVALATALGLVVRR